MTWLCPAPSAATDLATKSYVDTAVASLPGWYGTGADGDVTINADTSITSDMVNGIKHYRNLTVDAGKVLTWLGGVLYVSGTLTINGTLAGNGGASTGTSGGTGTSGPGSTTATNLGGNGSTVAGSAAMPTGNPVSGSIVALGGAGGAGGAGASGAGGAAGLNVSLNNYTEAAMAAHPALYGAGFILNRNGIPLVVCGAGRGGGGGGGDGSLSRGGGGGGGCLIIYARYVAGTGTIEAKGGAGGDAQAGNRGGGGGGGGGFIAIFTNTATNPFTLDVSGGAGGAKTGTGVAGTAGSTGRTAFIGGPA